LTNRRKFDPALGIYQAAEVIRRTGSLSYRLTPEREFVVC
jgi:hypothetical protein